jgi:hypothetical protein
LLRVWPLVFVGLLSYSVYLIHWPAIVLYKYAMQRELVASEEAALFLAIMALSYLSWRFIETPFRQSRTGWFTRKWIWIESGTAASATVIAALSIVALGGAPFRFSEAAMAGGQPSRGFTCRPLNLDESTLCAYGDPTRPRPFVAMVGDSHALSVQEAFIQAAADEGFDAIVGVTNGCPALTYKVKYIKCQAAGMKWAQNKGKCKQVGDTKTFSRTSEAHECVRIF